MALHLNYRRLEVVISVSTSRWRHCHRFILQRHICSKLRPRLSGHQAHLIVLQRKTASAQNKWIT